MVYESSYESGRKPFQPDTTRGYWNQPKDFIFISLGLAFKMDFFIEPMMFFIEMGIYAIIPYLICCTLYVVPLMVIHSFMGQFSSSGFISALRVSPLFKGMGYLSLALNVAILTYYSVFATVPLLYFFNSLKPTLPWSCEAYQGPEKHWNATNYLQVTICNATDDDLIKAEAGIENDTQIIYELPSVLFFHSHFPAFNLDVEDYEFGFSWELVACNIIIWSAIAGIFYKYFNTANLGKILRYGIWTVVCLLLICLIRFMFLPGAVESLSSYVVPDVDAILRGTGNVLFYTMSAFGPGWGSLITISSFNKFNTNIMRDSWIISIGQMLILMSLNFCMMLVNWHFSKITDNTFWSFAQSHWDIFFSTGSAIAHMSFANFWSLLFYGMLTLAALIVMVTQLYIILVSVFDEFEKLRAYKLQVTFTLIGVLAIFSFYLCTNEGIMFFTILSVDTLFTQTALNLLLLLVILWVYGRERFQRDIEFMLSQPFATWKVNMLRFISPLLLILVLLVSFYISIFEHIYTVTFVTIVEILFILLPWLSIPVYGFFITFQTTGSWKTRIQRSCRPTDWYPVEQEDRQRYEEAMGNENITHQLNELSEEVL